MTHQPSCSQAEFATKKKTTRREKFLTRMEALIPWPQRRAVIEPFYPKGERGRPLSGWSGGSGSTSSSHGMAWPMKPSKTPSTTARRSRAVPALISVPTACLTPPRS